MRCLYVSLLLLGAIYAPGCSAGLLNSIKNTVNSGVNDVENALGINDAPAPADKYTSHQALDEGARHMHVNFSNAHRNLLDFNLESVVTSNKSQLCSNPFLQSHCLYMCGY